MIDVPVQSVRDVGIIFEYVVHPEVRQDIEARELVVRGDVKQKVIRTFSFEQDAVRIVEGFLGCVPGGGYHELLALHVAARSVLAARIAAGATIVVEQGLGVEAVIEDFIDILLVDPWC
ncbi:hypothetical protein QN084_06765 [Paenarthrobacter sp. R1]|nr:MULTISPECIES: hypothetical protein [Paenarthrobacter]WIV32306.1 hypothetical protein QN084_06765 [Paenarthrobacter sp. R1]